MPEKAGATQKPGASSWRRRPLCVQVLATAAPHMLSRTALFRAASATGTWELTKNANSPTVPADERAQQHRAKGRGVGRPSERQRRPRKRFAVVADQADWI